MIIGLIDNVIGKSHNKMLLEIAKELQYNICEKTVDEKFIQGGIEYTSYTDEHTFDVGHRSYLVKDTNNNIHNEVLFSLCIPIVLSVKDAFPELDLNNVMRLKFNELTPQPQFPEYSYNMPHHDVVPHDKKIYSIVYYLNDSDGDTFLFNEFAKDDIPLTGKLSLNTRVKSVANTACIFESNRLHAGSNPKYTDNRYVINIVVESK